MNKFKPMNILIKLFLLSFYSSESCHLSEYTLKWFGGLFGVRPEIFPRLLNKFEVWVLCEVVNAIFYRFFCLTSTWNSTLCQIYTQIPDFFFLQNHFKIAIFGRYLIVDDKMWKTSNTGWVFFKVLLKHWTYFPKDMIINSKTRYLLHFFNDLISAFHKFQWMLRYVLIFKSFISLIILHILLFVISILFYLNLRHYALV